MKKPIGFRINEIFNSEKVSANPSILNLNFTHHESCFPDEELKKNNYNVTTLIDKFTVPDFVGDRYYSKLARIVAVICSIFISFTYIK